MVAVFGVSGNANISLGWPWWLAVPMALVLATIFGTLGGALAVRTEGIYTIMITLAIGAAFYYFTNQNWAIFNGHTGINTVATPNFWGVDWRADVPFYYLTLARRGALLFRRVCMFRARRSASRCRACATIRAAWRRSASTSTRTASRPMRSRRFIAALAGVLQVWNYRQISPGSVSVGACIDILIIAVVGGITPADRSLHRRLHLRHPAHLRARSAGQGRARRQPLPAADRPRLPRHRVLVVGRRDRPVGAMAPPHSARDNRRVERRARPWIAPRQRLSAVGAGAALELRGVTRLFGALAALTDVTITVRPGERRAVLGSNGAGKTTLFNCITGDFPPSSGTIRFFGEDVTHFPPYERIRRGLRRTYQISALFPGLTVRDNVYLACRGVSRGRFSLLRPGAERRADARGRER